MRPIDTMNWLEKVMYVIGIVVTASLIYMTFWFVVGFVIGVWSSVLS